MAAWLWLVSRQYSERRPKIAAQYFGLEVGCTCGRRIERESLIENSEGPRSRLDSPNPIYELA